MTQKSNQTGAVSLFVVIFAALLMTVITVSFIQLMTKDQEQATASDLSQSAYDSAQSGVEDAKRLLLAHQACLNQTASASVKCSQVASALTPPDGEQETSCSTLVDAGLVASQNNEVPIEQTESGPALDQAYTCVKITPNTMDYTYGLGLHESAIVPLAGTATFNQVEISWFSTDDVAPGTINLNFPDASAAKLPPLGSAWSGDKNNTPALLRAQLIQTGEDFSLSDFDDSKDGRSNANTLFLYPTGLPKLGPVSFARDARRAGGMSAVPVPTTCKASFASGDKYACSMKIDLPDPVNGTAATRGAFLRLSTLYNAAHFSVKLYDTRDGKNDSVRFNGVQPEVDSTGRANSLFRRVKSRIELKGSMVYPQAAVDIAGNLCKNFFITDDPSQYDAGSCTP